MANDIFAQRMALRSNALGGIMQALAQIKQKQEEERLAKQQRDEANSLFRQGTGTLVTTDLLNKPITPTYTGQQPSFDYGRANQLSLTNPMAKQALEQAMKGWQALPDGGDRFNPVTGEVRSNPKQPTQEKLSQGFSDFLKANAQKYAGSANPLEAAYADYQRQQTTGFEQKEQIKAKYRPQQSPDAKKVSEYVSEDGFKVTIFRLPNGSLEEVKSQEKVREQAQSPTMQKEEQKLSTLQELSATIRQQAKPEYLGGVTSGLAGQGFGGTLGGVREATGLIGDEEAQFRANVASLKNQLLYLRSGAQINESEFKRLEKELPDPTQPQNVFLQRLNTFDKQLNDILRAKGKTNKPAQKNNADPLGIR